MRKIKILYVLLICQFLLLSVNAQINVTGQVLSSDKDAPLSGASVIISGNNSGTRTDADGRFSINASVGNSVVVSFVGYKPKTVVISGNSALLIRLDPTGTELSEVVVTALGIGREKRSLGYSVGEVKGDEMTKVPQENLLNALTGKVTGLKISNTDNEVSSNPRVIIRGNKSLSGNDAPLIVIDGLPTGTDAHVLSDLSADNIASVTVLKGPSAAALYGSRAGSGVLLVTTKNGRGVRKGIGVSVNSSFSASVPYHFVPQQQQFSSGINGIFNPTTQQQWWGPAMGTPAIQWGSDGQAVPLKPHPNNVKDFVNTGTSFINDVGFYGSNDRSSFNLSVTDTRTTGLYPGAELRKNAVSLAASHNVTKTFRVSTNIHLLTSGSDNFRVQSDDDYPYEDVYFVPNYIDINDFKDYWEEKGIQQKVWDSHMNNPWFTAYESLSKFKRFRAYGNIKLDWDINSMFSLMARVGSYNQTYTTQVQHAKSEVRKKLGQYAYNSTYSQELNTDILLTFKKEVGDFSIRASGGGNLLFNNGLGSSIGGNNLILPGLYTSGNIDRSAVSYGSSFSKKRINSLYGVASADYKNVAYLEVTARNDWSSTLPVNNRSYFYPSVSASLIVSDMLRLPAFISLLKLRGSWASVGKDTGPYQLMQTLAKSNWGDRTTYSLPSTMSNVNLKPESIVSTEGGLDLALFNNRLGINMTYYQIEDRDQIMSVSTPSLTGFLRASVNAGIVRNKGIEIGLNGTPIQSKNASWNVGFNFTKNSSTLIQLPEGVTIVQFWSRTNQFNQTGLNGTVGDMWGNDVLRVKDGAYKNWPLLDGNGYVQRDPNLSKTGNVNNKFTLGFQSSFSFKRFTVSTSFDWRHGGEYFSESMLRQTRGGRQESWHKGPGSSTFTGILSSNSYGGNKDQLAQEIKAHPGKYDGTDGLVWVGGRTKDLGGFPLSTSNIDNGAFFPGVRADGQGGYVENFGGADTKYFRAGLIADPGAGWWSKGVQTWLYDASFIKMRELAIAYNLPDKVAGAIKAQSLSISLFVRNLMIWTKAKNDIDPESAFVSFDGNNYNQGWDRATMNPWTAVTGLKLNIQF